MMHPTSMGDWKKVSKPSLHCVYHALWGSNGMKGRCIAIDWENETVTLKSPKSKKVWKNPVKFSDLRHLRKNEKKEEENKG